MAEIKDAGIFFMAFLFVLGVPLFWVEVWKMLKTQSYEDSKGEIIRASDKPLDFRISIHLTFILACVSTAMALWVVKEAILRMLT